MRHLVLVSTLFVFLSCSETEGIDEPSVNPEPNNPNNELILSESIGNNPSGFAPLSARLNIELSMDAEVEIRVVGKHGETSDVVKRFSERAKEHNIPIHGLYADHRNEVILNIYDGSNALMETKTYFINTERLLHDLPEIRIDAVSEEEMAPGMTLVSYFGHNGSNFPQRPFIFDQFGDIRWYLNYRNNQTLKQLFYDVGVERLANGNLYFGDVNSASIYEVNMFGTLVRSWSLPGYEFHHTVKEMPNGNFLITASKKGITTTEDHILEMDRQSSQILNVWDLRKSLDQQRKTWSTNAKDWIHVNAIAYDENDDSIIISGRVQGVFKLSRDNVLKWILAPHRSWNAVRNGQPLSNSLLNPLNQEGEVITDMDILEGKKSHEDFDWNWYQHAIKLLPNGNFILFDNG